MFLENFVTLAASIAISVKHKSRVRLSVRPSVCLSHLVWLCHRGVYSVLKLIHYDAASVCFGPLSESRCIYSLCC